MNIVAFQIVVFSKEDAPCIFLMVYEGYHLLFHLYFRPLY